MRKNIFTCGICIETWFKLLTCLFVTYFLVIHAFPIRLKLLYIDLFTLYLNFHLLTETIMV